MTKTERLKLSQQANVKLKNKHREEMAQMHAYLAETQEALMASEWQMGILQQNFDAVILHGVRKALNNAVEQV